MQRHISFLLFFLLGIAASLVQAQTPPAEPDTAGSLRMIGQYPASYRAHQMVPLADGSLWFYGADAAALRPQNASQQVSQHPDSSGKHPGAMWYRPQQRGWKKISPPPECADYRFLPSLSALPNGKVLVAGGLCGTAAEGTKKLSLFNSSKERWESAPQLAGARIGHSASVMADGSVLLLGGSGNWQQENNVLASMERYHDGALTAMPAMRTARSLHSASVLNDGSLLVAGGRGADGKATAAVEIWDGAKQAWRSAAPLNQPRYRHSASLLQDGRLLLAGGIGADGAPLASAEIWDGSQWQIANPLLYPVQGHSTVRLAKGDVLLFGGTKGIQGAGDAEAATQAMLWQKASGQWLPAGQRLPSARGAVQMVARDEGSAWVAAYDQVLRFTPAPVKEAAEPASTTTTTTAASPASATPRWLSKPLLAPLPQGRVLIVGQSEAGSDAARAPFGAHIFDVDSRQWQFIGNLPGRLQQAQLLALPSGNVLLFDVQTAINPAQAQLLCQLWLVKEKTWQDCASPILQGFFARQPGLGVLEDERALLVASDSLAFAYEEKSKQWQPLKAEWDSRNIPFGIGVRPEKPLLRVQDEGKAEWQEANAAAARFWQQQVSAPGLVAVGLPAGAQPPVSEHAASIANAPVLLWDAVKKHWAFVLAAGKIGRDVVLLPSGCAFSPSGMQMFHPSANEVSEIEDIYPGIARTESNVAVLPDGTLVWAGLAEGDRRPDAGLLVRKLGCSGFAVHPDDAGLMPAQFYKDNQPPPEVDVASPKAAAPTWMDKALQFGKDYWLVLLIGLLPLLLYFLVPTEWIWQQLYGRSSSVRLAQDDGEGFEPSPFDNIFEEVKEPSWKEKVAAFFANITLRHAVMLTLITLIVLPTGYSLLQYRQFGGGSCMESRDVCQAQLDAQEDMKAPPTYPCSIIGIWQYKGPRDEGYTVTFSENGKFISKENVEGGKATSGTWEVRRNKFVWHHDGSVGYPDINPIVAQSDNRFTLQEMNGHITHFDLQETIKSNNCTRSKAE